MMAPAAAPAAKSELTAPSMDAVYELVGSRLKYLKNPGCPIDVMKTAKLYAVRIIGYMGNIHLPEAICESPESDEGDDARLECVDFPEHLDETVVNWKGVQGRD